jgi:hypothetical protein
MTFLTKLYVIANDVLRIIDIAFAAEVKYNFHAL